MSKRMKIGGLWLSTSMLLALGAACTSQPSAETNSAPAAQSANMKPPSDKGDQVVTGGDLAFMNDAAPGGMVEVELGELAVKQAADKSVKQFGQQMVADHSKAGAELKQLASQKKVMLPAELTPKQKETMEKLSKLKGADFDREYVKEMVADHEKDVAAFTGVAQNATDADVKSFAAKTLPTLTQHLQMIRGIADKMNMKP